MKLILFDCVVSTNLQNDNQLRNPLSHINLIILILNQSKSDNQTHFEPDHTELFQDGYVTFKPSRKTNGTNKTFNKKKQ